MKILINAIGAKKNAGGGFQIALNFVGTALQDNYHNNEYYFLISMDLAVALSLKSCICIPYTTRFQTYIYKGA